MQEQVGKLAKPYWQSHKRSLDLDDRTKIEGNVADRELSCSGLGRDVPEPSGQCQGM